jgi:hypothetical protein
LKLLLLSISARQIVDAGARTALPSLWTPGEKDIVKRTAVIAAARGKRTLATTNVGQPTL